MGSIIGSPVYHNQLQQCTSEYAKRHGCEFCYIWGGEKLTTFKIKCGQCGIMEIPYP